MPRRERIVRIIAVLLAFSLVIFVLKATLFGNLTLESLQTRLPELRATYATHRAVTVAAFFLIYVLISVVAFFPAAILLALAAGAVFGFWTGVAMVSLASTLGATIAFFTARYLFRDAVQKRFASALVPINRGIALDGPFYLLLLRMTPVFPFFAVNLCMAVTRIGAWDFFFYSELGMIPGTAAFVNAGRQLSLIRTIHDVVSPGTLASFALLGVLPLSARLIYRRIHRDPRRNRPIA